MDKEKKKKMEQKNELTNSGQRFPVGYSDGYN